MFEVNDYVVYKTDVCVIKAITSNKFTNINSYKLIPVEDESLIISVPIENKNKHLRSLMTLEDVKQLIKKIPDIKTMEPSAHTMGNEYRNLLNSGNQEDLIRIIKTIYLRNKERINNKKTVGEKDKEYFNKAEKYLYNELSLVLNMTYEETKNYIINMVNEQEL